MIIYGNAYNIQCIVGPYLQWLEDSSYESICWLCKQSLSSEECVRLLCFRESFPINT